MPKKMIRLILVIAVFVGSGLVQTAHSSGSTPSTRQTGLSRALESAVFIEVGRVYRGEEIWSTGSGFFVSGNGHVLTNSHVVSDYVELEFQDETVLVEVSVVEIRVVVGPRTVGEKVLPARVIDVDRKRDLALLKVNHESPGFLELESGQEVALTDEVFVMGFPFGEMLTFDSRGKLSDEGGYPEVSINGGRVTSLRKDDRGSVVAIQTDADINPGSSGGPMVDPEGRLVGVVYAEINGGSQIGFAVSPDRVRHFMEQQLLDASFDPPYIAANGRPIVVSVTPGELLEGVPESGTVVVRSDGTVIGEFELYRRNERWTAVVELPDGAVQTLTAEVALADGSGEHLAERLFNLRHESNLPASKKSRDSPQIVRNELSIHDYARKQAVKKAVDEGTVISSASARPENVPETTVDENSGPPPVPVDLTVLRNQARAFYRAGEYEVAAEIFAQIVAADPTDEVARDYLDLSRGRHAAALETATAGAGQALATITLTVTSKLRKGTVRLAVDGEIVKVVEFSKGDGAHELTVPAGKHIVVVDLEASGDSLGSQSFERDYVPGSRWSLRIDHPSPEAIASMYIVRCKDHHE